MKILQMTWPGTNWENFEQTDGTGLFAGNDCGSTPTNTPVSIPPLAIAAADGGYYGIVDYPFTGEHCEETDPETNNSFGQLGLFTYWDWETYEDDQAYTRHAQTTMKLQPGGRAVPGRRSLFQISGWAKDLEALEGKRAVPLYLFSAYGEGLSELYYAPVLPYAMTKMGSLGTLGNDGNLWVTLPDGDTPVDVTPQVGKPFYLFGAGQQKYESHFEVFVHQPWPDLNYQPWLLTGNAPPFGWPIVNGTDPGHAWWELQTEAPGEAIYHLAQNHCARWANSEVGFEAVNIWTISDLLNMITHLDCPTSPGEFPYYTNDPKDVQRTYAIGFPGLIGGLNHCEDIYWNTPTYNLCSHNCVIETRITGSAAGVTLPAGLLDWTPEFFGFHLPPNDP